ncbi:glycosyltransferase [Mucilaginibacter arboris]|uniref:Glycosyltransferase n=1 Tax=Mucilaginibacter arboris TaxID=2682090 RepID=A0A7K1SY13_9SPHI|nr:glycosyltransferase [Mucilaginibacter arboris]MVN21910.1 glycosyltransferase [Mucilaginibacter arboris]
MAGTHSFKEVSLLITHYNRSQSLERLLQAFKEQECTFGEIIVSDDASLPEHQNKIKELQKQYGFKLICAEHNRGLGNNINKGQDAVSKPYTLYVQEDFVPIAGFGTHFKNALELMQSNKTLDIVRFYAYFSYPYLKPYRHGFSEMIFSRRTINHLKFYYYSDHPHLRRSSFFTKFGRYPEGIKGDLTEYKMAISFLKHKGKGLFYNDFNTLFDQRNTTAEPSTMKRSSWRQNKNILTLVIRSFYLKIKLLKGHLDLFLAQN